MSKNRIHESQTRLQQRSRDRKKQTPSRTVVAAMSLLGASLGASTATEDLKHVEIAQAQTDQSQAPETSLSNQFKFKQKLIAPESSNETQSNQFKSKSNQHKSELKVQSNQWKVRPPGPPNRKVD